MNQSVKITRRCLLWLILLLCLTAVFGLTAAAAGPTTVYYTSFEDESQREGWVAEDWDGDGNTWYLYDIPSSSNAPDGYYCMRSDSYTQSEGALTPNNLLYSPWIDIPSSGVTTLNYMVFAIHPILCTESYAILITDGVNETTLLSETLRNGDNINAPLTRTVDLSAYAGEHVRLIFQHFNCTDIFALGLDAVKIEHLQTDVEVGTVYVTVPEPQLGKTITNSATTTDTGYTVANAAYETTDTVFQAGKDYDMAITVETIDGYVFPAGVTACVNGNLAQIITRSDHSLKFYYTFPALMSNGWHQEDGIWYYYQDGAPVTGWQKIGGQWYYFNTSGAMQTGWQKIGGQWYYFKSSGAMKTGWLQDGGKWYYLKASGTMATGWLKIDGTYYYFTSSGIMKTGWLKDGGKWYYLKSSGAMATGWLKIDGSWYYFTSSGAMKTGWLQLGSKWYYLKPSGVMVTGRYTIDGTVYYFDSNGVWIPQARS